MNSLELLTQAEAPRIYMYNAMASALSYCHRLSMPLEYFVHLLVGLIVCNENLRWDFCTMRNFHTLLGTHQGFPHELATEYAFLINLNTKKRVIIDAHTV